MELMKPMGIPERYLLLMFEVTTLSPSDTLSSLSESWSKRITQGYRIVIPIPSEGHFHGSAPFIREG